MRFSKSLYAVAILAVPTRPVLGSLDLFQINNGFQQLAAKASTALGDLNNLNVATGDLSTRTVVNDYKNIASGANSLNSNIQGSKPLTTEEQNDLISTMNEYTSRLASVFQVTGDKAGDFEINPDQDEIEEAATDAFHANDALLSTTKELGPQVSGAAGDMRNTDAEAYQNLVNDDENSPLRRRRSFKA